MTNRFLELFAFLAGSLFILVAGQTALGQVISPPRAVLSVQNVERHLAGPQDATPVGSYIRFFAEQLSASPEPYDQITADLYMANNARALWHNGQQWTPAGRGVFQVLVEAEYFGLDKSRYLGDVDFELGQLGSASDIARVDALLSAGVMRYVLDAKFGRQHTIAPITARSILGQVVGLSANDAYQRLVALNPADPLFWEMRNALVRHDLPAGQKRQIAVTMHRLRTQPFEPMAGKQVVVDLGLQHLIAYENNVPAMDMDVVIGKPDRRTPLLSDQIVSLKFSPDWTVPASIVQKDLVPIMATDPSAIADLGLAVRTWDGDPIDESTINWAKYVDGGFPYTFYQKPGMNNLLGGVRFSLTNDFNIYLHDSPDIEAFHDGTRAHSSGCVRVGDATGLASWIMADERNWSEHITVRAMISGETRDYGLREPVNVKFVYSTVTLDENGQLVLMPDIYGEDLLLAQKLGI